MSDRVGRPWGCCEHCLGQLLAGWQAPAEWTPVWIEFALLARSARVERTQLELTGAGLVVLDAPCYPFRPACAFATRLAAAADAAALPHVVELDLLDEQGTLQDRSVDALQAWPEQLPVNGGIVRQPIVLNLEQRIGFDGPGRYALVLVCDGVVLASLPLVVRSSTRTPAGRVGDHPPRALH